MGIKFKNQNSSKYTNKLLSNKYVLYTTLALSCLFLLSLLLANKIGLIIVFALISYIIHCFNRNMIIVLGLSLIITYIATLGMKVKEGLENKGSVTKQVSPTSTPSPATSSPASTTTDTATVSASSLTDTTTPPTTDSSTITPVVSSTTKKESMDIMSNKKRNRIDYASTVEDAYDDLNKILGSDGMQRLTQDTHKLMEQQVKLADAMKNMTPLIDSAKTMMSGFDFNGLSDMAKQFMPSK